MPTPDLLRDLLTAPGPSGYETAPANVWREAAEAFATDVKTDVVGSTSARVPGTDDGLRLLVAGHIDEIGVIVTHIDDKGFLWFMGVGGWDPIILVGQRLELITSEGTNPGRRRQEADPSAQARRAQGRRRGSRTCTSTSAPRTRRRRGRWCASAMSR